MMVLYTPLAVEDIFPQQEEHLKVMEYQGKTIQVRQNEEGQYQLVRLISTNPEDYLHHTFQPGAIIHVHD